MSTEISGFTWECRLIAAIQIGLAVSVVCLLLVFPPAPYVTETIQASNLWVLLAIGVLAALLFRGEGVKRETLQTVAVFALFAMPLVYKWQFAITGWNVISGIIPWKDAANYYYETLRLLDGASLTEWGARRPLFAAFASSLLRLNGGNFSGVLVVLLMLNAFGALAVSRLVAVRCGAIGAAIYLVVAFKFYARFSGAMLSEQLGFLLGNLALFYFLAAVETRRFRFGLFGLAALTLALNARAGAFFILPALAGWLCFEFRRTVPIVKAVSISALIVLSIMTLNFGFVRAMSGGQGVAFSNYAHTLYGIAAGNRSWQQVSIDHPGVADRDVLPLAVEKIKKEPLLFVKGMIGSSVDFLAPRRGAFGFIDVGRLQAAMTVALWVVVLLGVWRASCRRMGGCDGLSLASLLGVTASLPLLPPIDSDGMRVFAATIPFSALWIITGAAGLAALLKREGSNATFEMTPRARVPFQNAALGISLAIVLLALLLPILARFAVSRIGGGPAARTGIVCGEGETVLQGFVQDHASVTFISDAAARESQVPYVRVGEFRRALRDGQYPALAEGLERSTNYTHLSFVTVADGQTRAGFPLWLRSSHPVGPGEFTLCARRSVEGALSEYPFYDAIGWRKAQPRLTFSQRHPALTFWMRMGYGLAFLVAMVAGGVEHLVSARGAGEESGLREPPTDPS